jgi:hypothetical protein
LARSFAEAAEGIGVAIDDQLGGVFDAISMLGAGDILANGSPGRLLHRDPLSISSCPESGLFVLGQS